MLLSSVTTSGSTEVPSEWSFLNNVGHHDYHRQSRLRWKYKEIQSTAAARATEIRSLSEEECDRDRIPKDRGSGDKGRLVEGRKSKEGSILTLRREDYQELDKRDTVD